jgi:MraZ protein
VQDYFVGTEDYQLDDRNRIPIPPLYRAAFERGGYINRGQAPCLQLYTPESFATAADLFMSIPAETEEGDDARRAFFGSTRGIQKDTQGRITLKDDLLAYAGITKEVVVVGVGDKFEIWDREAFNNRVPRSDENRTKAAARQQGAKGGA